MRSLRYAFWTLLFEATANFGCQCRATLRLRDEACRRCRLAGRALEGMSNATDWGDGADCGEGVPF